MKPSLISLAQNVISQPFKRSQQGLFHGKMIQHGNNVPFSKHKTRRTWLPNVHSKGLFSEILQKEVDVKLTARALRTIKKVCISHQTCPYSTFLRDLIQYGGIDQYVLAVKSDLLGNEGMRLRVMIRDRLAERVAAKELPVTAL